MESLVKALSDPVEYVRLHLMMIEEAILIDVCTRQAWKALVSLSVCPVETNGSSWSNFVCPRKKYVEPVKILVVCQSSSPSPPLLHHYRIRRAGRSRFDRCHTEFEWHCVLQSHAKHCTLMYCSVTHSFCDIVYWSATQNPCDIVQCTCMHCSATHSSVATYIVVSHRSPLGVIDDIVHLNVILAIVWTWVVAVTRTCCDVVTWQLFVTIDLSFQKTPVDGRYLYIWLKIDY